MDYEVIWSYESESDLDDIAEFISRDSAYYASSFVQEILDVGNSLKKFPNRGRVVPEMNNKAIRELFIKEYRVIYKIENKNIFILGIVHGRRDLDKMLNQ